jgi:cytochrome c biogenesis protein CcmG/thiol:disulfide interchange protein DsbE
MDKIVGADPALDAAESAIGGVTRRRLIYAGPTLAAVGLAALFASRLGVDPSQVPSNLIGKRVPVFSLPPVQGRTLGLSSDDLHAEVSLVNVFASWCVACREEHSLLLRLKNVGSVPIHGLNYKDHPDDAARWLNTMGDPYTRTGADRDGRVAIDWGVYGVPETFVVGADGTIAYKHIGPLNPEALDRTILPLVTRLREQARKPAS